MIARSPFAFRDDRSECSLHVASRIFLVRRFAEASQWALFPKMPERTGFAWSGPREAGDEPVDVPRHLAALKRTWPLIVVLIALMTGTALVLSLAVSKTYRATAQILMDDRAGVFQSGDVESVTRRLATVQALLTTRNVLERASDRLPRESAATLKDKVESSVDPEANIVDVVAKDGDSQGAAAIANAVARSFLTMQETAEKARLARARAQLQETLNRLRASPARVEEARAVQERLTDLNVSQAGAGAELQLAQAAEPPSEPDSPRPVRNTIFAFFASAFIAVLAALAVDRLAPRLSGPRELSRLTGTPILAALPLRQYGRAREAQTEEAYQALQASALQLPSDRKVVLVTSAYASEEKSTVAVGLAESLARAGYRTLIISADLRRPRIEQLLDVPRAPGLTDVVQALGEGGAKRADALLQETVAQVSTPGPLDVHVLPSGSPVARPAQVFGGEAMGLLFRSLRDSDYRYVLVDGSPLLGVVDGQLLAGYSDAVLAVCRLDRTTPASAVELGDVLEQLQPPALGLVVVGARGIVPSFLGFSRRTIQESQPTADQPRLITPMSRDR
jgi:tyrosine-protein kinase